MIFVFIGLLLNFIGGVCISYLWNWFIHPALNLPTINFAVGIGIMCIYDILNAANASSDMMRRDLDQDELLRVWALTAFTWLITMIVGYVVHVMF